MGKLVIINEKQLRQQIGATVQDPRFVDYIETSTLDGIIEHHTRQVRDAVKALLQREEVRAGVPEDLFQPRVVTLDVVVNQPVTEARLPPDVFPYALRVYDTTLHTPFDAVEDLRGRIHTAPFAIYGYEILGSKVYVSPPATASITMHMAAEDALAQTLAVDVLARARAAILKEAQQALENTMKERTRHGFVAT